MEKIIQLTKEPTSYLDPLADILGEQPREPKRRPLSRKEVEALRREAKELSELVTIIQKSTVYNPFRDFRVLGYL